MKKFVFPTLLLVFAFGFVGQIAAEGG